MYRKDGWNGVGKNGWMLTNPISFFTHFSLKRVPYTYCVVTTGSFRIFFHELFSLLHYAHSCRVVLSFLSCAVSFFLWSKQAIFCAARNLSRKSESQITPLIG